MYCPSCGTQNTDQVAFCSNCGTAIKQANPNPIPPPNPNPQRNFSSTPPPNPANNPGADTIIKIVAFCIPLVGLILYPVWNKERPHSARDVCTFAAIGFGAGYDPQIVLDNFKTQAAEFQGV